MIVYCCVYSDCGYYLQCNCYIRNSFKNQRIFFTDMQYLLMIFVNISETIRKAKWFSNRCLKHCVLKTNVIVLQIHYLQHYTISNIVTVDLTSDLISSASFNPQILLVKNSVVLFVNWRSFFMPVMIFFHLIRN